MTLIPSTKQIKDLLFNCCLPGQNGIWLKRLNIRGLYCSVLTNAIVTLSFFHLFSHSDCVHTCVCCKRKVENYETSLQLSHLPHRSGNCHATKYEKLIII